MITGIPRKKKSIERLAGLNALLISFLIVTAIFTGIDLDPEPAGIHEDLTYLSENLERIRMDTWIWFINSILIILFGPLILMSFLPHGRSSAYLAAFLISSTGMLYLVFSLYGFNTLYLIKDYFAAEGEEVQLLTGLAYQNLVIKIHLQLAAYTLAGLSAVILGLLIARTGHIPKYIGWLAMFGGLIYAVMGWVSKDNLLFTLGRLIFVISLILLGTILLLRGLKRQKKQTS